MHIRRRLAVFVDRFPLIGPIVWVLGIQYFINQAIVAAAWAPPGYSWRHHLISDLGNTACGQYSGRFVCSPQHALMNASFITLGITMALGAGLIYREFRKSTGSFFAFSLMGYAGLGTLMVGLFPENVNILLHGTGAALGLLVGNVSLVVLALVLKTVPFTLRAYSLASGVFSIVAFALFMLHINLGLGQGTMERLVSYPQTLWLILFGLYMSRTHLRAKRS